jgi:hypothetical protein
MLRQSVLFHSVIGSEDENSGALFGESDSEGMSYCPIAAAAAVVVVVLWWS